MKSDGAGEEGTYHAGLVVPAMAFLWFYNGVNYLAFKVGVEAVPALVIGGLRFTVAGLLLLPLAAWRIRQTELPLGRELAAAALTGVVLLVGGQVLMIWSVRYLPAGVASVFGSTPPMFLALFVWLLLRQPLGRRQLAGVGVGFAGLALMGWSSAGTGGFHAVGAVAVLASCAAWAAGSLLQTRLGMPKDPVVGLAAQLLTAGLPLWPLAWLTGASEQADLVRLPTAVWAALLFLTFVSTLAGFAVFTWVNRAVSPTLANTYNYVAPVIAMGLAALFLHEPITWMKVAASATALLGVALMVSGHAPGRDAVGQRGGTGNAEPMAGRPVVGHPAERF